MPTTSSALKPAPHTSEKHRILREYLAAWLPILGTSHNRIVYIDGFAGSGSYEDGGDGSPVIALDTALEHTSRAAFNEIVFWFIEAGRDSRAALEEKLAKKFPRVKNERGGRVKYFVVGGKFEDVVGGVLDKIEESGDRLAPTFAYIDPFGFTGFSMDVIKRILGYSRCEVMVTFMDGFINRFHGDRNEGALNALYGTDAWKGIGESGSDEGIGYVDLYKSQLEGAGAKYVKTFRMVDCKNQTIYHLVYATKHIRGMKAMKTAMQKASRTGEYEFSDRTDPNQALLIEPKETTGQGAAASIFKRFGGMKSVPVEEVEEYVWTETEYVFEKSILKGMEDERPARIAAVRGRKRRGTYPGGCRISFAAGEGGSGGGGGPGEGGLQPFDAAGA